MIRVTTCLDYFTEPELLKWIENNSKAKRKAIQEEALRIGSIVDLLIQLDIKQNDQPKPIILDNDKVKVENCMRAWETFKMDYPSFVPGVMEMQTELNNGEIMGHPDFIHINGITDLKCSSGIRPRYWTQVSEYFNLRFKNSHVWGNGFIAVLRLDKVSGLYEYRKIEDQSYIDYEISIFNAYHLAFNHNEINREIIRQQLEKEILECSTKSPYSERREAASRQSDFLTQE